MTNEQYRILDYCYKRPRKLTEIRESVLKMSEHDFLNIYPEILDMEIDKHTVFDRDNDNWESSLLSLSKSGVEIVEQRRFERREKRSASIRGWITTVIAAAAFILSVISLILQSAK